MSRLQGKHALLPPALMTSRPRRSRRRSTTLFLTGAVVTTAIATTGTILVTQQLTIAVLLAVLIIAGTVAVIVLAFRSAIINGLEIPVAESLLVLVVYGIRPLFDLAQPRQQWVSADVTEYYTTAMVGTALFFGCYLLAYFALRPRRDLFDIQLRTSAAELTALRRISWGLAAVGLIGLAATIRLAGGLSAYLSTRSGAGQVQSIAAVQYLITLGVVAGAIRIGLAMVRQNGARRRDLVVGLLMAAPVSLVTVAEGSRRYVLPLVAAVAVLYFLLAGRRVPIVRMLLVAIVGIFLLIPQENIRTGGSQQGESYAVAVADGLGDPASLYDNLFSTQSTSMVSAFALGIGDSRTLPQVPGAGTFTLSETVLQPIPQQIWPSKPDAIRNDLISERFGLDLSGCITLCPTYGPMMTGYADLGLLGTALLGLFVGAFSASWTKWTLRRGDLAGRIAYALCVWGFVYMWWSNLGTLTLQILFFGLPVLLSRLLVGRGRPHGVERRT